MAGGNAAEQRGRNKVTPRRYAICDASLSQNLDSILLRPGDELKHASFLLCRYHWATVQIHLWAPALESRKCTCQSLRKSVVDFFMRQQPASRRTGLSRILQNRFADNRCCGVQVSVVEYDLRRLPAEFQSAGDVIFRCCLLDHLPNFG